jgi:hypothetical protein
MKIYRGAHVKCYCSKMFIPDLAAPRLGGSLPPRSPWRALQFVTPAGLRWRPPPLRSGQGFHVAECRPRHGPHPLQSPVHRLRRRGLTVHRRLYLLKPQSSSLVRSSSPITSEGGPKRERSSASARRSSCARACWTGRLPSPESCGLTD